jgi:hypothetical protein
MLNCTARTEEVEESDLRTSILFSTLITVNYHSIPKLLR